MMSAYAFKVGDRVRYKRPISGRLSVTKGTVEQVDGRTADPPGMGMMTALSPITYVLVKWDGFPTASVVGVRFLVVDTNGVEHMLRIL